MSYPSNPSTQLVKPAVLTPENQRDIIEALAEGNYLTTACESVGISVRIFYYWKSLYDFGDPIASKYADFFHAVQKAMAFAEREALKNVKSGGVRWQSEVWYLERKFPKKWGRKDNPEKKDGKKSKEKEVDLSTLTDEQLQSYREKGYY